MSDQVYSGDEDEWRVHWAAGKTWTKLIAMTFAIAIVCICIAVIVALIMRVLDAGVASVVHGDWIDHWLVRFPIELLKVAITVAFSLLLARTARNSLATSARQEVPKAFPLAIFSADGMTFRLSWLLLTLALGVVLLMTIASFESVHAEFVRFGVSDTVVLALAGPLFASRDLTDIAWRLMAEKRSCKEWMDSAERWNVVGPSVVMALLAVTTVLGSFLILTLFD